jgi:hypothetical protein
LAGTLPAPQGRELSALRKPSAPALPRAKLLSTYRCRICHGYYTLLTGTVFEKTRQRLATLVLLLRGIAEGEPTARLARELGMSRTQLHTLRQRIQANLNETEPTSAMHGTAFEADELYQNAGQKRHTLS